VSRDLERTPAQRIRRRAAVSIASLLVIVFDLVRIYRDAGAVQDREASLRHRHARQLNDQEAEAAKRIDQLLDKINAQRADKAPGPEGRVPELGDARDASPVDELDGT
jgi:hypothetical protein